VSVPSAERLVSGRCASPTRGAAKASVAASG
jgi:hypothetical protein